MSKKSRKHTVGKQKPAMSRQLLQLGLQEADRLLDHDHPREACAILEDLHERFPRDPDVLNLLVIACHDLHDMRQYQFYAEQLLAIQPNDPELLLGIAGAAIHNLCPAIALQSFRRFVQHYPFLPQAAQARQAVAELELFLDSELPAMGFTGDDRLELALLHDRMQMAQGLGDYPTAYKIGQQLLQRAPTFVSVHNNLSILEFETGQTQSAIEHARFVLNQEPENFQALGNLARYLHLTGQPDEARQLLHQLMAIDQEIVELVTKQAETATYLGEDHVMLDVYRRAETNRSFKPLFDDPLIHHLAAVAALRLGDEKRARHLWKTALKLDCNFALASQNLADLDKPVAQRNAPWPFIFVHWLPRPLLDELGNLPTSALYPRVDEKAMRPIVQRHPELITRLPVLLDRADPTGRRLAMSIALVLYTPEMLHALHDYALGQRGPDELRLLAAQAAQETGLLPDGPVRLWIAGEWRELFVLPGEISWEPTDSLPPPVMDLYTRAVLALRDGKPATAEPLLRQALTLAPDSPVILNNLAATCQELGRDEETYELVQQLRQAHPDYLFGITAAANQATEQGDYAQAENLLRPLMQRNTLHVHEFEELCKAYIRLGRAKGDDTLVTAWLNTWEMVDADSATYKEWRTDTQRRGRWEWLTKRRPMGLRDR